jgi:hypothetical protein
MSGSRLGGFYSNDCPVPTAGEPFFDGSPAIVGSNVKGTGGVQNRLDPSGPYPAPLRAGGSIQPTLPSGRR